MTTGMSVAIYRLGPKADPEAPMYSQDQALGHFKFVRAALRDGKAVIAGPFCAADQVLEGDTLGVMVLDLSPEQAQDLIAEDPAITNGVFEATVYPFYPARS